MRKTIAVTASLLFAFAIIAVGVGASAEHASASKQAVKSTVPTVVASMSDEAYRAARDACCGPE